MSMALDKSKILHKQILRITSKLQTVTFHDTIKTIKIMQELSFINVTLERPEAILFW
jgi:hypothetical protein